jgi:hypothetical protein
VSDSKYSIETITKWYPNRLSKGTDGELLNLDIVKITYDFLVEIKKSAECDFIHVRGHQEINSDMTMRDKAFCGGNKSADELCGAATKYPDDNVRIKSNLRFLDKNA